MAKKKKSKYDITVGLNTDFENALGIIGNKEHLEYLSMTSGSFILNKNNPVFPPQQGKVSSKKFNSISIKGTANHPFYLQLVFIEKKGVRRIVEPTGNIIETSVPIPSSGLITFEIEQENLDNSHYCKIDFELKKV